MTDPVTTITASAIVTLAVQEFIKSGAGELAKKFTAEAIAKIGELRTAIWNRLRGKSPKVDEALAKAEQGDLTAIVTITKHLDVVMDEDSDFAAQIKAIAQEINIGKIQDNSHMEQNIYYFPCSVVDVGRVPHFPSPKSVLSILLFDVASGFDRCSKDPKWVL